MQTRAKRLQAGAAEAPEGVEDDADTPPAAAEGEPPASPPPQLPAELLVNVLARVSLRERLARCALVSTAWRAAAAATITTLSFTRLTKPRLSRLLAWTAAHGSNVTGMQLAAKYSSDMTAAPTLLQPLVPAANQLRELELRYMQLQLALDRQHAGILAGLTSLTRLDLQYNSLLDGSAGLKALPGLTGLQDLRVDAKASFPARVLSDLVQLTRLELASLEVPAKALRNLSRLSGLLHLSVRPDASTAAPLGHAALANIFQLPQLTELHLSRIEDAISNSSTPGLSRLTALQVLAVEYGAGLHPEVLAAMACLQDLSLDESAVLGGPAGVAAFLQLPALQQLQRLHLMYSLEDSIPVESAASAALYSALTSSSQLSSLALTACTLPGDAWTVLFNRPLPAMCALNLNGAQTAPLTTADLQNIAAGCPGLQQLCALSIIAGDADLSALLQFPRLTALYLNRIADEDAMILSGLTRLQELRVTAPNDLTYAALQDFQDLKQLTMFCVYQDEVEDVDNIPDSAVLWWLENQAPEGQPPDVWEQMFELYPLESSEWGSDELGGF